MLAALVGIVVACLVLFPTGRYLLRAGWEEGKILARRTPITALVADSATPTIGLLYGYQQPVPARSLATMDAHRKTSAPRHGSVIGKQTDLYYDYFS